MMDNMLRDVTIYGTAAKASVALKRQDLAGKTGTTNEYVDAWFCGYQMTVAGCAWMGFDQPKKLGDKETGGGLSLPVWISFMESALKKVPVMEPDVPEGIIHVGGEWYYDEFSKNAGVTGVSLDDKPESNTLSLPPAEEKKKILDLFRN